MSVAGVSTPRAKAYERDGVLFPVPVLSAPEAAAALARFEELAAHLEDGGRFFANAHLAFRWVYDLACHPRVLDAVEEILGEDLAVFGTLLTCKYPGDQARVPWHQDGTSSQVYSTPATAAWIALVESTPENGCMRAIPGTHTSGRLEHDKYLDEDGLFKNTWQITEEVDESRAVDIRLAPGEMSLHHSNVVHGSSTNQAISRRIGLIVRFVDAKHRFEQARPAVLARGERHHQDVEFLAAPPAPADLASCLETWHRISA